MSAIERKRIAVEGRLGETFRGQPITEELITEIRGSLPEGWVLNDWTVDDEGELNISVTGPPESPAQVRARPVHLSVVQDPET